VRRGALSIAGFCDYASIGRTATFAEIKAGRLIAHKRGRSTIILIDDADAWLRSLPRVRPSESDTVVPELPATKTNGANDRGSTTGRRRRVVEADGGGEGRVDKAPATFAPITEAVLNSSSGKDNRRPRTRHRTSSLPRDPPNGDREP
jgi:hypothetical protein